ncbi:MAG: recombination-associated protein RdgC [Deltaproteobacteria bacterium]|nr:recombination-associated protein RdgC [Deltaproteobacteria bacterium]
MKDDELMGFLKGMLTFTRYHVIGDLPQEAAAFIDERIKRFSFRDDREAGEEKSLGWTSLDNILDTDFSYANYSVGDYIFFTLRIDRKTAPPALLRLKTLQAEQRRRDERQASTLSRAERQDIKEAVRTSLIAAVPAVPSVYEVCWAPSKHMVYFGSNSDKAIEEFEDLFTRTFQVKLSAALPWDSQSLDSGAGERLSALASTASLSWPGKEPQS